MRAMTEGRTANVDGYEIAWEMFKQVSGINLVEKAKQSQAKCLIVQISPRQQELKRDLSLRRAGYHNGSALLTIEEPFWREIRTFYSGARRLYQDTLPWLEEEEVEL